MAGRFREVLLYIFEPDKLSVSCVVSIRCIVHTPHAGQYINNAHAPITPLLSFLFAEGRKETKLTKTLASFAQVGEKLTTNGEDVGSKGSVNASKSLLGA